MGYTTYHRADQWTEKDKEGWNNALPIIKQIFKKYDGMIQRGYYDELPPEANGCHISLNGVGDYGVETFFVKNNIHRGFCKTRRQPYDIVVSEICLILAAHCDNFELRSDGWHIIKSGETIELDGSWNKAMKNVEEYGIKCEIIQESSPGGDIRIRIEARRELS